MISHRLGIEVIETMNPSIMKIIDLSVYSNLIPVVCPRLWVTAPGFDYSEEIDSNIVTSGFNLTLTACNLGLQKYKCDSEMNELPDGIYSIRYAVSPHEYLFVDVNHLRTTLIMQEIENIYCRLESEQCHINNEKEKKLMSLYLIESKLRMAKAKVKCGNSEEGMIIFNSLKEDLSKINCKNC